MEKVIVQIGEGRFYPRLQDAGWNKSVTTVTSAVYPKSKFLIDWQIDTGKEEAERILKEAGEEGTAIHSAIEKLIAGEQISVAGLSDKQKKCVNAFIVWYNEVKPEILAVELRVDHDIKGFAGRIDLVCRINGQTYIVDFKSSNSVQDSHHVQIGGYILAYIHQNNLKLENVAGAILHLNSKTKRGYSWIEVDTDWATKTFDVCNQLFDLLNPEAKPKTIEYPLYFKL